MPELILRQFTRTTRPQIETLADTLRPLLAVAAAGSFHMEYDPIGQRMNIWQAGWTGVDLTAVQTAVTNCVADTEANSVKFYLRNLPLIEKAERMTVLDQINLIRSKLSPPLSAITLAQYIAATEANYDSLNS